MPSNPQPEKILESRIQAIRDKASLKRERQDNATQKALHLTSCLERAGLGVEEQPIKSNRTDQILIDNPTWAGWIQDAGLAFSKSFDLQILVAHPLPDEGLGIEEGLRLLRLAAEDESLETITSTLTTSRKILGPWEDLAPRANIRQADSELGIAAFFAQLHRYCDGYRWSPPPQGKPKPKPKPFEPSSRQLKMLDFIAVKPAFAKNIAAEILGNPKLASTIRDWVRKLRNHGYEIETDEEFGYRWVR